MTDNTGLERHAEAILRAAGVSPNSLTYTRNVQAILAACQALRDEGRREGLEAAAKHIEPSSPPSDWTEYATIRYEAAQSIRAIDPAKLGEG